MHILGCLWLLSAIVRGIRSTKHPGKQWDTVVVARPITLHKRGVFWESREIVRISKDSVAGPCACSIQLPLSLVGLR